MPTPDRDGPTAFRIGCAVAGRPPRFRPRAAATRSGRFGSVCTRRRAEASRYPQENDVDFRSMGTKVPIRTFDS